MAKADNITDLLIDVADAIRAKKGTSELINPQDFSSQIASIETASDNQRVSYLRRNKVGYIETGVLGANSNLKIFIRYAMRTFPAGYWSLVHAYENETTDATRILMNKNTTILGALNSIANSSASMATTRYAEVIYTDCIQPDGSAVFRLYSNGEYIKKARSNGNPLTKTITLFPKTEDVVDIELYELKIYDGSTLIRDYYPVCRQGEYGLWDSIEQKFYGNEGEGSFSGEIVTIPNM